MLAKPSLCFLAALAAGCVGASDEVILHEGEGAIIFGSRLFVAAVGGRDEIKLLRVFNPEGVQLQPPDLVGAVTLESNFCVDRGYSILNLEVMEASVVSLPDHPVFCRKTGAYPCFAFCADTSSVTWRVERGH